jgi:protein-S-isoprenylcysteine O-methyltransferase Ste14
MRAALFALYSVVAYALFFLTFLYAIGFVEGVVVPKTIDSGAVAALPVALAVDLVLLGLFAVQHSVMARPAFKRLWTTIVPVEAERSTYVLFATGALALILWQWRPLPATVWSVGPGWLATVLTVVSWIGWAMVLLSTFLISHFQLFGLTQGLSPLLERETPSQPFVTPLIYKWVRHPIYLGFILAFWATPSMSLGHLVFAAATCGYILIGIWFEERDLVATFGQRYLQYRQDVGMLIPRLRLGGGAREARAP